MAATQDILATYRGPGRVLQRLLARGTREDLALIYLMTGCLMVFVAQTPRLARQAHQTGEELSMLLGATLLAWIFIAPLLLYALAALTGLLLRALGRPISGFAARMALFWALLAAAPLLLLWGMTAGFVGPGPALSAVGILWAAVFVWFWLGGLIAAARGQQP
jgi:hypothetical protein